MNHLFLKTTCLALFVQVMFIHSSIAQTATQSISLEVDGSALIAVYKNNGTAGGALSLSLQGATEAGAAIQDVTSDATTRLRMSSLVDAGTRKITARISEDLPTTSGTRLSVVLTSQGTFQPAQANGGTCAGTATVLTTADQELVTGIGTCWTQTADDSGYILNYTFERAPNSTFVNSADVTITYTITAEA